MPLETQILRNGHQLQIRWGSDFYIAAMALAACFDTDKHTCTIKAPDGVYDTDMLRFDCYPDAGFPVTRMLAFQLVSYPMLARTPLGDGVYTLTHKHQFIDLEDMESFTLLPGDELHAYRAF